MHSLCGGLNGGSLTADNLEGGVVGDGGKLAPEGAAVAGVGRGGGADAVAGLGIDEEVEGGVAVGGVVGSDYLRVHRGEVAALIDGGAGGALEINTGHSVFDVEPAHIVGGAACGGVVEVGGEILDKEAAEVLILSVAAHIVGRAGPECLFIKLQLVGCHAAEEAGAELSVADGQRVFHPLIADAREGGGLRVPQGEGVVGGEGGGAADLIVVIDHIVGADEEEGVVDVASTP